MACPKCGGNLISKKIEASMIPFARLVPLPDWVKERVIEIVFCEKCGYVTEIYLRPKKS